MHANINWNGLAGSSQLSQLMDIVSLLCGAEDTTGLSGDAAPTNLTGKIILSSAAVGITSGSNVVTWTGANNGADGVDAERKTLAVGQKVAACYPTTGIPVGATVATITNGVGFTISANATVTNAAAILSLSPAAGLPAFTIGSVTQAMSTASSITQTLVSYCIATQLLSVGMKISSSRLPAGTTISTIASANTITTNNAATSAGAGATFIIQPASQFCNYAASTVNNAYDLAGWKLEDQYSSSAALAGRITLSTTDADGAVSYMSINPRVTGSLYQEIHETWNASAHVPTNTNSYVATGIADATLNQRVSVGSAVSMVINATPYRCILQSTTPAGIGSSTANAANVFAIRTRETPWDTLVNGYPNSVLMNTQMLAGGGAAVTAACRFKNPAGGDLTGTAAVLQHVMLGGFQGGYNQVIKDRVPDGLGKFYTPRNSITVNSLTYSFLGGSISELAGVWGSVAYAKNLDEVVKDGVRQVFLQTSFTGGAQTILLKKG